MQPRLFDLADASLIPTSRDLPSAAFAASHLLPRRPVVIDGAAREWKAFDNFTPQFFQKEFPRKPVTIGGRTYPLEEYLDVLLASDENNPAPYPCNIDIHKHFPELLPYVAPRLACAARDRLGSRLLPRKLLRGCNTLEVFFGGPGGRFPYLHYDYLHLHAFITQLYGEKRFTIYPPGQEQFLYVDASNPWKSTIENHHDPDLARYPLFAHARRVDVELRAGQTLFIPCGWWHTARSLSVTISVAFDLLDASNWDDFVADNVWMSRRKPLQAALLRGWLAAAGLLFSILDRVKAR